MRAREPSFPPPDFAPPANTGEARIQDIDFLGVVFGRLNCSFTSVTRGLFESRLRELKQHVDYMTHGEFVMGISRAVAAADDGHTRVLLRNHLSYAPVRFHWFSDGLYVVRAKKDVQNLLGAKVVAIGKLSPEAILRILQKYLGGTPEHIRVVSAELMNSPDALQGIAVLPHDRLLPLRLRLENGKEVGRRLDAHCGHYPRHWYRCPGFDVAAVPIDSEGWLHVLDSLPHLPLYLDVSEANAHDVKIPRMNTHYLRINTTLNLPECDLDEYLDNVLTNAREESPRYFIVDVRFNQGGDFLLVREFAKRLPDLLGENGRLFIIVGNHTFSAGLVLVALLKYYAKDRALIVGQRVGDRERFWAEGGVIELPNSGLPVCLTDGFHNWADGYTDGGAHCPWFNQLYAVAAGSLAPDIEVTFNFADYLAGHDSTMERVESEISSGRP